jgi:hypothetical protein
MTKPLFCHSRLPAMLFGGNILNGNKTTLLVNIFRYVFVIIEHLLRLNGILITISAIDIAPMGFFLILKIFSKNHDAIQGRLIFLIGNYY